MKRILIAGVIAIGVLTATQQHANAFGFGLGIGIGFNFSFSKNRSNGCCGPTCGYPGYPAYGYPGCGPFGAPAMPGATAGMPGWGSPAMAMMPNFGMPGMTPDMAALAYGGAPMYPNFGGAPFMGGYPAMDPAMAALSGYGAPNFGMPAYAMNGYGMPAFGAPPAMAYNMLPTQGFHGGFGGYPALAHLPVYNQFPAFNPMQANPGAMAYGYPIITDVKVIDDQAAPKVETARKEEKQSNKSVVTIQD